MICQTVMAVCLTLLYPVKRMVSMRRMRPVFPGIRLSGAFSGGFCGAKRYGPVISGVFKRRKLSEELTWPAGNHIIGPEHRQAGRTEHKRIRLCIPEIWIYGLADRSVTGDMGIIIEVKYAQDGNLDLACEKALRQIAFTRYEEDLADEGVEHILKYAIAVYKKQCKVALAETS